MSFIVVLCNAIGPCGHKNRYSLYVKALTSRSLDHIYKHSQADGNGFLEIGGHLDRMLGFSCIQHLVATPTAEILTQIYYLRVNWYRNTLVILFLWNLTHSSLLAIQMNSLSKTGKSRQPILFTGEIATIRLSALAVYNTVDLHLALWKH